MAKHGAPLGNINAVKGKWISDALRKALAENRWERLNQGARAIADAFAKGEPWAATLVFDRFEGKPALTLPEASGTLVISWMTSTSQAVPGQATAQPGPQNQDVIEHIPHTTPQHVDVNASKPGLSPHHIQDVVVSDTADQAQSSADAVDPDAAS